MYANPVFRVGLSLWLLLIAVFPVGAQTAYFFMAYLLWV